jgi:arylsulfatase A
LFYYRNNDLRAVRSGPWKLHEFGEFYNLDKDIGEKTDVAAQHPDIVGRLLEQLEKIRRDLGDTKSPGKHVRVAGLVKQAKPLIPHKK